MKKIFALMITLMLFACSAFSACDYGEKKTLVIATPDGAPTLCVYQLMKNVKEICGYDVEYKIIGGAANIATVFTSGEADIAVMPTNVSAKLYNKGTDLKLMSVNVFGVLYMVGSEAITSLNDLLGKVVLNIGRGGTPDITLKLILDQNEIPYVESETAVEGKVALNYVSEASEVIAMLKAGKANYGVMGEPAVTNAVKATGGQIVLDMQSVWNGIVGEETFTQAGVVVNEKVYKDEKLVAELKKLLDSNLKFIYEDAENVGTVLQEKGSSLKVAFTKDTLDRCNLKNVSAKDVKGKLEAYFTAVADYDSAFIGGKLPDENYYL